MQVCLSLQMVLCVLTVQPYCQSDTDQWLNPFVLSKLVSLAESFQSSISRQDVITLVDVCTFPSLEMSHPNSLQINKYRLDSCRQ